ncbi:DNA dC-_dU-editing enzyme APOBEC-3-like [Tamandua tetradactyla]|uniref:DNA dC->dU-editing enzyme APOBEC-3-like n=1 Tax=Tamandua tetradactyla TaxID=48850 RepID=UPI0040538A52
MEVEPEHTVPRGRPRTSYGGSSQAPAIRNPVKSLTEVEFNTHFKNSYFSSKQKNTYLCYRVEREGGDINSGIIQCQDATHAEQRFLDWFCEVLLDRDMSYQITWYISWSPCDSCAQQVTQFLQENRSVSLSLLAARLYWYEDPKCREELLQLWRAGAQINIMSREGFKNCWENFVDTGNQPFQEWENLEKNSQELVQKLKTILKNPMHLLKEDIFYYQFNNRPRPQKPYRRRRTYVCYQLQELNGSIIDRGYFQTKKRFHAEIHLINKIRSMTLRLGLNSSYQVTCYVTWSPCLPCARALAEFIEAHRPHLSLQLFVSRLYFHWRPEYQEGLQLLGKSQITVTVMSSREFVNCWRNFVNHQGKSFQPWNRLVGSSNSFCRRLERIQNPRPRRLDGLNDAFRNLQLVSP